MKRFPGTRCLVAAILLVANVSPQDVLVQRPARPSRVVKVSLTASPNPIMGRVCACGPGSTDHESVTTLTIKENGFGSATVTSIAVSLKDVSGNIVAAGQFNSDGVNALAGSNRLLNNASLTATDV